MKHTNWTYGIRQRSISIVDQLSQATNPDSFQSNNVYTRYAFDAHRPPPVLNDGWLCTNYTRLDQPTNKRTLHINFVKWRERTDSWRLLRNTIEPTDDILSPREAELPRPHQRRPLSATSSRRRFDRESDTTTKGYDRSWWENADTSKTTIRHNEQGENSCTLICTLTEERRCSTRTTRTNATTVEWRRAMGETFSSSTDVQWLQTVNWRTVSEYDRYCNTSAHRRKIACYYIEN